jgi:hypothetical protein
VLHFVAQEYRRLSEVSNDEVHDNSAFRQDLLNRAKALDEKAKEKD